MGPVRFLHKIGARRNSICHKRLFVGIVLRLITNQDAVLDRSGIYIIQFSSVSDGGNFARRQRAHSLLLLGRSYGERSKPGLHEQRFVVFERGQRSHDGVERFPAPRRLPQSAVDDEVFRALGGYRDLRLMEDLDFSQRLKARGRSVLVDAPVVTSGRRFLARGPWRTFFFIVWLLARWTLGLDTERYAERWRGDS